jgi:hypothetical protein
MSLLKMLKLPVGVDQPGLPEAMGETSIVLPPSISDALWSDKLMITLLSAAIPALPHRSVDSATTQLINVFILIPGCSRRRNRIGVNADIAFNCGISAEAQCFFLTKSKQFTFRY